MLSQFVLEKFDYVTPEMRFLIAGLLLDFYSKGQFVLPAKELSKKYGVSLNTINATLKYLVQSGYVERFDVSLKKGRPIGRYVFTQLLEKKLKRKSELVDSIRVTRFWDQVVRQLFCAQADKEGQQKFNVSNRYLICILALFSDDTGVVRSLPVAKISKMTGFTPIRLRSQLGALLDKNVLISYMGGVTGKFLFGKAVGVYFLDTLNVANALNVSLENLPFSKAKEGIITPERGRYMVHRLYKLAELLSVGTDTEGKATIRGEEHYQQRYWNYEREVFSKLVPFFGDREQTRVADYLQIKLEQYVSSYLTIVSQSLKEEREVEFENLEELITKECIPAKWKDASKMEMIDAVIFNETSFSTLGNMLFCLVEGVASYYTEQFNLTDKQNSSFRIVPFEQGALIESYERTIGLGVVKK